jgi:hypothetical protein
MTDEYNRKIRSVSDSLVSLKKRKEELVRELSNIENEIAGFYSDIEDAKMELDNHKIPATEWHTQLARDFSFEKYAKNKVVLNENFNQYYRLCMCNIQCAECHQYEIVVEYLIDKISGEVTMHFPSLKKGKKSETTGFLICESCAELSVPVETNKRTKVKK